MEWCTTIKTSRWILFAILVMSVPVLFCGPDRLFASDAATIRIGGTGGALGTMNELAAAFRKKNPGIPVTIIPHLGTRGGIRAVLEGAIDIGISGRHLAREELLLGLKEVEYAMSPFVFVTSQKGEKMDLTYGTVARIYRGEISKWPDGTPIRVILRPEGDVDTIMLKTISPEMRDAVNRAAAREGMTTAIDDQENCDKVEQIRGAFGTSTLAQIISERRSLIALPLNGVAPEIKTMVAGAYPHYKIFHMVTGQKSSPLARKFVEFAMSAEGKRIISGAGNYTPRTRR